MLRSHATSILFLGLLCLGVLICAGGVAHADRPKIAVLGLEVAPGPAGAIDPGAVLIAKEVTRELRQRVQAPACPYQMAPNSSKELLDEKLLMSCDNEATDCMVLIGVALASDVVLYGRVEKRGEGFRISLKLLDVKRKQIQSAVDDMPAGGVAGGVRRLYRKLIGDGPSPEGGVVVRARTDGGGPLRGGSVILDDEVRGTLTNGRLAVTGVPEGRHTVAISVGGFRRFEELVTVRGGEQVNVDAVLHRQPTIAEPMADPAQPERPAPATGRPSPLWKVSLAVGAASAVAGGAYAWYSYDRQQAHAALVHAPVNSDHCGDSDDSLGTNPGIDIQAFRRACTWTTRTFIGYSIAGIGAATAVVSLIMMSRDPGPPEGAATGGRPKKSDLAIMPLLGPGVAGAQLGLSW
jgi:PEGA domain